MREIIGTAPSTSRIFATDDGDVFIVRQGDRSGLFHVAPCATGERCNVTRLRGGGLGEWQRPWTIVDYAGIFGIALAVGGLALVFWNPIGPYGRYKRNR
jgi:hypothetical protein